MGGTKQAVRALATVEIGEERKVKNESKGKGAEGAEGQQHRERERKRVARRAIAKDQECVLAVLRYAPFWRSHDVHGLNDGTGGAGVGLIDADVSEAIRNSLLGKIRGRHRLWTDFHFWRESFSRDLEFKLQREGAQEEGVQEEEGAADAVETEAVGGAAGILEEKGANKGMAKEEGAKERERGAGKERRRTMKARRARRARRAVRARRVLLFEEQCEEFVGFMVGLGVRSSRVHQAVHYWCTTHTLGHASDARGKGAMEKEKSALTKSALTKSAGEADDASTTKPYYNKYPNEVLPPQLAAEVLHVQLRLADSLCSATIAHALLGGAGGASPGGASEEMSEAMAMEQNSSSLSRQRKNSNLRNWQLHALAQSGEAMHTMHAADDDGSGGGARVPSTSTMGMSSFPEEHAGGVSCIATAHIVPIAAPAVSAPPHSSLPHSSRAHPPPAQHYSPRTRWMATGGSDFKVRLWSYDSSSGTVVSTPALSTHSSVVNCVAIMHAHHSDNDGTITVLSGSADHTLHAASYSTNAYHQFGGGIFSSLSRPWGGGAMKPKEMKLKEKYRPTAHEGAVTCCTLYNR
jgi:hypothetical protein